MILYIVLISVFNAWRLTSIAAFFLFFLILFVSNLILTLLSARVPVMNHFIHCVLFHGLNVFCFSSVYSISVSVSVWLDSVVQFLPVV